MKILILGGYGVFGGRLVELLADCAELVLLVAGRNESEAIRFCEQRQADARLVPLRADREDIGDVLRDERPYLLVDATGPFQEYGRDPYGVIRACIRCGTNYLDFADGSDFVLGVGQFDAEARTAKVFVLSGVSSFPVLTAAVVAALRERLEVRSLVAGIAPSPYAGVGRNVMRAVLGYTGGPVRLVRDGREQVATGFGESRRYTVGTPGFLPLRNLRFSLVDVPDLRVIPGTCPGLESIWVGAGPVPETLHRILNGLAWLRARLRLPPFTWLTDVCYRVMNQLRFGEHRGGMFVEATCAKGQRWSWHLLAEGDDGPYIPSMAIDILVRKLLAGAAPPAGARPAVGTLDLDDYLRAFARRRIHCGFRGPAGARDGLFPRLLGDAFYRLPEPLRELHAGRTDSEWQGAAEIVGASRWLAKGVARLFGFPVSGGKVDVNVRIFQRPDGELWIRRFASTTFRSVLTRGEGRDELLICERFGVVTVSLALVLSEDRLHFVPRRLRIGSMPLPRFLLPTGASYETVDNGRFAFNVTITMPIVGFVAAYRGTLVRVRK